MFMTHFVPGKRPCNQPFFYKSRVSHQELQNTEVMLWQQAV